MAQQEESRVQPGSTAAAISNAVVHLFREYTGRGPTKAKTVITRDLIAVVLEDTMTKGERSLVADGKADVVRQMRHEFQRTMRDELIAAVESRIGRKVVAFMSDNHIAPDMGVELFVLEPRPNGDHPDVDAVPEVG